jgi:hypothetical protein
MKKGIQLLVFFMSVTCGMGFSQMMFPRLGEEIKVKNQYQFNVVNNGWQSEITIINKSGSVMLTFIPFKIQDGWASYSNTDKSGSIARSGTTYSYFYRVAEPSGTWCDVPIKGLLNTRNVARYVLTFGLVKNETLDRTAFDQFCAMHGKVHDNLKYFK